MTLPKSSIFRRSTKDLCRIVEAEVSVWLFVLLGYDQGDYSGAGDR